MSRITGSELVNLMEAYTSVYHPQELTEEQVWEKVENWVNSLVEEGYDLSDYTWEQMYSGYLTEILGLPEFGPSSTQINKWGEEGKAQRAKERSDRATNQRAQLGVVKTNQGYIAKPGATSYDPEKSSEAIRLANRLNKETGLNKTTATKKPAEPVKPSGNAPTKSPTPTAKPTPTASKPTPTASAQTGDKAKDMATWAKANPGLAAAAAERARTRGTSQSDNPLMKGMSGKRPMTPSVQSPTLAKDLGKGSGNQSLLNNPNASKSATPPPAAKVTPAATPARNGFGVSAAPIAARASASTATAPSSSSSMPAAPKPAAVNRARGSSKPGSIVSGFDPFDVVMGHLLDEGYADTEESALVIMANMSEEWRQNIVERGIPNLSIFGGNSRKPVQTSSTPKEPTVASPGGAGGKVTVNKSYPATLNKEKGVKAYGPTGTEYFTPNISGTNIPDTNRHKFKSVASKQYERVPNSKGDLTPKVDDSTKFDPAYKPISMRKPGNFKY